MSAISGFCEKCNKFRKRYCDGNRNTCMSILFDIIEALQQKNNGWQERYDELDAGHSRLFKDFCKLRQENEQLRARVARMREVLEQFKYDYEQNCPLYQNYLYACQLLREDTGANYHNPADVEALRKAKKFLDRIYPADVFTGESGDEGALMVVELRKAIDKAIGGKEDA